MALAEQIQRAKKKIRELKKVSPESFPEYSRLYQASLVLKAAQDEYNAAKKAWRNLGR
jgi:hypothetical protein